MKKVPYKWHKY